MPNARQNAISYLISVHALPQSAYKSITPSQQAMLRTELNQLLSVARALDVSDPHRKRNPDHFKYHTALAVVLSDTAALRYFANYIRKQR